MTVSVKRPDGCDIPMAGGRVSHGVNQEWYPNHFRRMAGCGPSTASNMLRYWGEGVSPDDPAGDGREQMTQVMQHAWEHVTPGVMGLNSPDRFVQGMDELLNDLNSPKSCRVLNIPKAASRRPGVEEVAAFLEEGLLQDSPVAFLNLHNGNLPHLDRWHWVTLMAMRREGDKVEVQAIDNGNRLTLDLRLWLETTALGGGFVYCA